MAINLWKLAGQPTVFSLTTSDLNIPISTVKNGSSYRIRFKLNSTNLVTVKINVWGAEVIQQSIPNYKSTSVNGTLYDVNGSMEVTLDFSVPDYGGNIQFATVSGTAQLEVIQLVEKPLQKLTINGIDGFQSGKWVTPYPANYTIVDDETIKLSSTASFQYIDCFVKTDVVQTYTVQCTLPPELPFIRVILFGANRSVLQDLGTRSNGGTITTITGTVEICFRLQNNTEIGTFTFKRPMLNVGSIPAPYEKKRGERMVLPVAKKNLLPSTVSDWESGSGGTTTPTVDATRIRCRYPLVLKKGITYSMSFNSTIYDIFVYDNNVGVGSWYTSNFQFTVTDGSNTRIVARRKDIAVVSTSEVVALTPQLEEGNVATQYKPYAVQVNDKPLRYVPKKNLIPSLNSGAWSINASRITVLGDYKMTETIYNGAITFIKTVIGKQYTLSHTGVGAFIVEAWADTVSAFVSSYGNTLNANRSLTFTATQPYAKVLNNGTQSGGTGGLVENFQLEEGSVATPYEAYQQVLPRSRTGLSFNGTSDCVSANNTGIVHSYLVGEIDFMPNKLTTCTLFGVESQWKVGTDASGTIRLLSNDNWAGTILYSSAGVIKLNERCRIKVVLDGTSKKIYLNDVFLIERPMTGSLSTVVNKFGVGAFINSGSVASEFFTGVVYKVKVYDQNTTYYDYDFTNPSNTVGNTVIPNAKNLIPSFEDARWSLHANAKVYGSNVLQMVSTGQWQTSQITISVIVGRTYMFGTSTKQSVGQIIDIRDKANTSTLSSIDGGTAFLYRTFVATDDAVIFRTNHSASSGTFTYNKLEFYQLDGKEGTLTGAPIKLEKTSKRTLYSKR